MNESLSLEEKKIVLEEETNLKLIQTQAVLEKTDHTNDDLFQQIVELKNSIEDCNADDLPSLADQITRLNQILHQRSDKSFHGIDTDNPYFARLCLQEENLYRDLYLGTRVFLTPDKKIQVVDWKNSPISSIYFKYDIGDEYEEEIAGKWIEGVVICKRIIKIEKGVILRIQQGETNLFRHHQTGWEKLAADDFELRGGSGSAVRPLPMVRGKNKSKLGAGNELRTNKYLPAITSLIDQKQYDLITKADSGLLAIQGTAGSGKTTVALHRIAWLAEQDSSRFGSDQILVIVFSKALANYISKLLPSLGIEKVRIDFFENWAAKLRSSLFGNLLPAKLNDYTPVSVIRLKRHPLMIEMIDEYFSNLKHDFLMEVESLIERAEITDFPLPELHELPYLKGLYALADWILGKRELVGRHCRLPIEVESQLLKKIRDRIDFEKPAKNSLVALWDEIYSDFDRLGRWFLDKAGKDFSQHQIDEAMMWIKNQYVLRQERKLKKRGSKKEPETEEASLDAEDDPILLYLYQVLMGELVHSRGGVLQYSHLLIDEAQDLSLIELRVLLETAKEPKSVTLCGDENQQIIQYNTQWDWDTVFSRLGLEKQTISTLQVSYRSSRQIMEFALGILGESLATKEVSAPREGPPVEMFGFAHQGELARFLSESLKHLMMHEPEASIAVILSSSEDAKVYFDLLSDMEILSLRLVVDQDFSFTAGIDVTEVKQVKGLEFDYVILVEADYLHYPANSYSRFLLHVASTRAAHQLWILNHRSASPVLPLEMLEIHQ